jgi:uncharacterized protein YjbI with pentapeptide repeats
MANQQHLDLLKQGVDAWNRWREQHSEIQPDLKEAKLFSIGLWGVNFKGVDLRGADLEETGLSKADLRGADLRGTHLSNAILWDTNLSQANLREAHLLKADLMGAKLMGADLSKADLRETNLNRANLSGANLNKAWLDRISLESANLSGTNLKEADLRGANLNRANLSGADLSGADLSWSTLNEANLSEANLTGCSIYAISAWNVQLRNTIQTGLIITRHTETAITVDNLEVAQFIYLLLNNKRVREIIDTITSKVVLILGRFTPERKAVLDALREELRQWDYLPVLFDFEKPANRDLTETVSTLAHLARFIIVDLTDPSSAPYEVATIVPQCVVPVQPLLSLQPLIVDGKQVERREFAMFEDLRRRHHWVLPTYRYQDTAELLASLQAQIIAPAEQKARELTQPK